LLPETKKKRRDWRRLGASELDSSGVENKDIKAHLPVPSERWGVVFGGRAMVRTLVAVGGFLFFVLFTERGVRWEEEEEDGGAREEMV
jgi:hypothetical protein